MIPANISFRSDNLYDRKWDPVRQITTENINVRRKKKGIFFHKSLTYDFLSGVDGVYLWFL